MLEIKTDYNNQLERYKGKFIKGKPKELKVNPNIGNLPKVSMNIPRGKSQNRLGAYWS